MLFCMMQALLDVGADSGWLRAVLNVIHTIQMLYQARWLKDSTLMTLPHVEKFHLACFRYSNSATAALHTMKGGVSPKLLEQKHIIHC